jgi:hypothetical protein
MQIKPAAIGGITALLLVGAGCEMQNTVPNNATQQEEAQAETAPAVGTERRATQPTAPASRQATPDNGDSEELKTNPGLTQAENLFEQYRTRMTLAAVAAAPKIAPLYDKPDWANYEPYAKAMYDEGLVASKALLEATNAFENKESGAEVLIAKANTAMKLFLEKIQAFEARWAVSGQ